MKTRLLSLLLCTLMVLGCLTSCGTPSDPAQTTVATTVTEATTPAETEKPVEMLDLIADGKTEYSLVRSESSSQAIIQRVSTLRTQIKEATGASLSYNTDWIKRGDEVAAEAKEIVIGTTNRPQTLDVLGKIREKDFAITYAGGRLVITGGNEEATLRAVDYFVENYLNKETGKLTVPDNLFDVVAHDYPIDGISIKGVDIREYQIVVPLNCDLYTYYAGVNLADFVKTNAGITLNVVTDDQPETEYEFLVGKTNRAASSSVTSAIPAGQYILGAVDKKIVMQGDSYLVGAGVGVFLNEYVKPAGVSGNQDVTTLPTTLSAQPYTFAAEAKSAILMIGDGMGHNHVNLALANGLSEFVAEQLPNIGSSVTKSQSVIEGKATFTDSAASATALATGHKTVNGYVGVNKYVKTIQNVRELADSIGAKTAVLTTDVITGATPGGFLCHHFSRNDTAILQKQVDDLIENGMIEYCKGSVDDKLIDETRVALQTISEGDSRFFAMIEEGYIDKHAHNIRVEQVIHTVKRYNESIAYAVQFVLCHPGTALVITADHETGGITENSNNQYGYVWTSHTSSTYTEHTNRDVPLYAVGSETEYFKNNATENIDVAKFIASVFGATTFGQ
ncbi:MAG: alkaline phosphatase [Clostridia bacterium]|nr:alkaline phosphatase [Clostridia bacterium]